MAFEDGLILGQLLRKSETVNEALHAFEERRRDRVAFVQRESFSRLQANTVLDDKRLGLRDRMTRSMGRERLRSAWEALVTTLP